MKRLFSIFTFQLLALALFSQVADSTQYIIETIDGNEYSSIIYQDSADFIMIKTDILGFIKIKRSGIKSIKAIEPQDVASGEYWFKNPHATRYFYSPNGYNLRKGEAYYQNTWVFFNQLSYGFSEYFSMGVGMMPLFLVGAETAPVWITPKIGVPLIKDKLNVGIGALAGYVLGEDFGLGIFYGTVTYGGKDRNSNLGVGWGYTSDGMADYPMISYSAMARVSKKGYFISENYLIPTKEDTYGVVSFGGRSVQKKLAIDYGLIIPLNTGADVFIAVPWLSITIPFGNNPVGD